MNKIIDTKTKQQITQIIQLIKNKVIKVDGKNKDDECIELIKNELIKEIENINQSSETLIERKSEIEKIHQQIEDSINYAALIQHSVIPTNLIFQRYFSEYFKIWHPKNIVGGDIYLIEEFRDNECLLMVIDCTGHGVAGAFVTMLVKAIEKNVTSEFVNTDKEISPAQILNEFNQNIKQLLKQEDNDAVSNVGFDGGILYFNMNEGVVKFAGAETPLFYIKDDKLTMIKGDRQSIGYKTSKKDYQFTDHIIEIDEGMKFYLTTDGYLDQNGGEKSFPYGKKKFKKLIEKYHNETFADQQEIFLYELLKYRGDEEVNDDITLIGLKL